MTVSVASRQINSLTGISELGRLVLSFVDGGLEWLNWAIADPRARYHFEDESALVAGVQAGLHASPFLLLPVSTVLVSPVKLMTIGQADLLTLQLVERGNTSPTVTTRATQILTTQGIVTQAQLAGGMALLNQWKLTGKPLFQCMGFADQLAMFGLLNDPGETGLDDYQQEAANFAVVQATTPVEFCDYFRAYLQQIAHVATLKETPDQRQALVQDALDTLLPLMFDALDCPRVEGLVAPWEVAEAIDEWLMMGRQLGFSRVSLAVQQVIANTGFRQQTGADAALIVNVYLAGAQALLKSAELGPGQLGQDGATCVFQVAAKGGTAIVNLGADGIITLASYIPPPPPTKPEKK
jgi:hypothetical protein